MLLKGAVKLQAEETKTRCTLFSCMTHKASVRLKLFDRFMKHLRKLKGKRNNETTEQ